MTRFWGGSPTLTDAQAAELFASRLPAVTMPADLAARVTERVLAEVRRVRALVTVRSECAWCRKHLGTADWPDAKPGTVTHGICKECAAKLKGGGK